MAELCAVALITDCKLLVRRLVALHQSDELSPERLAAISDRLSRELSELRELVEVEEVNVRPLPVVAMRFHGPFGIIDGGLGQ